MTGDARDPPCSLWSWAVLRSALDQQRRDPGTVVRSVVEPRKPVEVTLRWSDERRRAPSRLCVSLAFRP
jgi:hypothetical protein